MQKKTWKALLLGSGELGKEVVIELQRLGIFAVACDSYDNAPAMQVAHEKRVFNMKNAAELRKVILDVQPTWIIPEVEAIATAELLNLEKEGFNVVPKASAAHLTMNREAIRNFAAIELNLPTAKFEYANTYEEFKAACEKMQYPCFVKPLMSSSGKGQSKINSSQELFSAWENCQTKGRTGAGRVIVEQNIPFESEITLLTVRAVNGTFFCDAIGHKQVDGDYIESWQPHAMSVDQLEKAKQIAKTITEGLGGFGLFGVELFLLKNGEVLFSEVSPRPHDTGLVTLCTQVQSEFALHVRAFLGLPVTEIERHSVGASVALKSEVESLSPLVSGLEKALEVPCTQVRIFGKPTAHVGRRMGVVLSAGKNTDEALQRARISAGCLSVS